MDVVFDPAKDAVNLTKHSVSFAEAASFEWADALVWPDARNNYGEPRMAALGYIGLRLMAWRSLTGMTCAASSA